MYKLKTTRSIKKRFKVTSNGKLLKRKACKSHLLQKKTSKRKRRLRTVVFINNRDICNLIHALPYLH
uniref:Large ribosomal subunit protein bL35c n=1 Tax=Ophidocladus simpliciusculus TaxID=1261574 RepID=A0A1Z1MJS0_9FLOR|nr:ribosomal protein L35 [Ophidocladus simpliciusculus]ARW66011.1 ribosomal protein L35 [Ophidocladus simpliciusculus]